MKVININVNKYFHLMPLWRSPLKLPLELPVELGYRASIAAGSPKALEQSKQFVKLFKSMLDVFGLIPTARKVDKFFRMVCM